LAGLLARRTELATDDRIPILVGCGQLTQRETDPRVDAAPIDLTAQAARLAIEDAGPADRMLAALDTIVMIRAFADTSWRFACPFGQYKNPPKSLSNRIGATAVRRLIYTWPGGNMPQWSVNRLCEMIARGEVGAALIAGGEALATQKAAQRANLALDWSEDPGGGFESWGIEQRGWSDIEDIHGMRGAIFAYPLIEAAIRAARGSSIAQHCQSMGQLLERFARVARDNPLADRRQGYTAREITEPSVTNPYIGLPYTKLMNANAFIDQAAALVLTSVGFARRLGIDRNRWVYLHGCADAHDHWYLSERMDLHRSPAIRLVSRNALEMARIGLADIDAIDLYSCFASAVAVACEEIGLSVDDPRGLTITGGLPYFGGPGNNYVTHSIAQMMHTVRARPGSKGLVTANGNYLTKHSAGIYSTEPPSRPFSVKDTAEDQALLDRLPRPKFVGQAEGSGQIDTYTVMFERDRPVSAIVLGHLDDGSRFIANTAAEVDLLNEMCRSEYLGRIGRVSCDGGRNLFRPS
jgi:acetyl-CoA C-acetyltransferase